MVESRLSKPLAIAAIVVALVLGVLLGIASGVVDRRARPFITDPFLLDRPGVPGMRAGVWP